MMTRTLSRLSPTLFPKNLFDDLMSSGWDNAAWPAMDTLEMDDKYVVYLDVPGVKEEDVDITFDNGILRISGRTAHEYHQDDGKYYFQERSRGNFTRSIKFTRDINTEEIDAVLEAGVLKVVIPKTATSQVKQIPLRKVRALE